MIRFALDRTTQSWHWALVFLSKLRDVYTFDLEVLEVRVIVLIDIVKHVYHRFPYHKLVKHIFLVYDVPGVKL